MSEEHVPEQRKTPEDLARARNAFIAEEYPRLFGSNFDSDSIVEITSLNVTALLMHYEEHLTKEGLIGFGNPDGEA